MSRILYGCCKQYVGGSHQFRNYQGIQSPSKCQEAFIQCSADTNLPKEYLCGRLLRLWRPQIVEAPGQLVF
ncbi:hypothetical protein O3P69_017742, partial [Scylla paramamosain]